MNCTECHNLDRRNGECQQLKHFVVCSQCGQAYDMQLIRCEQCLIRSTTFASVLKQDEADYVVAKHCPLSEAELGRLKAKQDKAMEPVVVQRELF